MLEALWPRPPSLGLLRLKQCFPGSLSALLIFRVFTGGSLAIVVVRYRGIWGFFELRGWIVAGRFALALFVVADSVTLFCVCRGFRKTQKDSKSITCKQWSFMIWSVSTYKYTPHTFTHGNRPKTVAHYARGSVAFILLSNSRWRYSPPFDV